MSRCRLLMDEMIGFPINRQFANVCERDSDKLDRPFLILLHERLNILDSFGVQFLALGVDVDVFAAAPFASQIDARIVNVLGGVAVRIAFKDIILVSSQRSQRAIGTSDSLLPSVPVIDRRLCAIAAFLEGFVIVERDECGDRLVLFVTLPKVRIVRFPHLLAVVHRVNRLERHERCALAQKEQTDKVDDSNRRGVLRENVRGNYLSLLRLRLFGRFHDILAEDES